MSTLRGQFLLAMPTLKDTYFGDTLTFLCEHDEHGALGIVVNRPLDFSLSDLFDNLEIEEQGLPPGYSTSTQILSGGPVQGERGFVLHSSDRNWECTLPVTAEVGLTTSGDVLRAIASNQGPSSSLIALGYAGWGAGQLEEELAENAWITLPADPEVLFSAPIHLRRDLAASHAGIDMHLLSSEAGHC